jgi:hypothetical protein
MITKNVVTYEKLLESLQENIRLRNDPTMESNQRRMLDNKLPLMEFLTEEEQEQLKERYDYIMKMIDRYIPEGAAENDSQISIWFGDFRDGGGYQMIAEGSVSDLGKPQRNEYNWHLQNTSQWLFAFGFVFDTQRRDFSIHT